jgi:hypothetical protein
MVGHEPSASNLNRHARRVAAARRRSATGRLKLRCIGCDRVGREMTKEHVWPKWLIDRAGLKAEPVRWLDGKLISASSATIPLCAECNHTFGGALEEPVSRIFDDMEGGKGITDREAELLVRWLWKFEGLFWGAEYFGHPHLRYSELWTMRERVLGPSMEKIRPALTLALSLIESNDEGHTAWPVGIDSGITAFNGIFVSGVFCRTAMMVLLDNFAEFVPENFGLYQMARTPDATDTKVFMPPIGFKTARDAIQATGIASQRLAQEHNELGRRHQQRAAMVLVPPRRVEIP